MRLADFIELRLPAILQEWEQFARTLLPSPHLSSLALRDHAEEMLHAVAADLRSAQSPDAQQAKSWGRADAGAGRAPQTAAQLHGAVRAAHGISIQQLVAEFRALRASVLRLYAAEADAGSHTIVDIGRFNEAIDQAIAESAQVFQDTVERWRDLLLSALQHDLRGPLQAVLSTAYLAAAVPPGPEREHAVARLRRSGERMKAMLDELLDYNRATLKLGLAVTRVACDLAPACLQEVELRRTAHPGHTIGWRREGDAQGLWDASRVQQALGNLIANAAKHGGPAGEITVELRGTADAVELSVSNPGPPIDPEAAAVIFEPLRRAPASPSEDRSHLGLGLFIVREVARAHGGEVSVASGADVTTFLMRLPKAAADPADPPAVHPGREDRPA